jgi:pyruvate dehydrogenase E2 component (dihydrolipoamide acetyltransferase)
VKKLTNIRKLIAKAMHESLQNSAQLTHHLSADVRKLLAFREEVKKAQKADPDYPNITLNDMICWAVIRALEKFPEANSHFLGDSIKTFKKVHLGLAVDTPRGLMVPVLKNAGDLSLKGLSSNLRSLADSCRKGAIDPELLQSTAGSFTVSNLGNYGVEMFTPVINLPQVAILGVNTIIQRPADIGGGIMAFVPYIGLSLTYDHRAIDGGPATLFLKEIKSQIENFSY